jgi:hypothetical protein
MERPHSQRSHHVPPLALVGACRAPFSSASRTYARTVHRLRRALDEMRARPRSQGHELRQARSWSGCATASAMIDGLQINLDNLSWSHPGFPLESMILPKWAG